MKDCVDTEVKREMREYVSDKSLHVQYAASPAVLPRSGSMGTIMLNRVSITIGPSPPICSTMLQVVQSLVVPMQVIKAGK